MSNNESNIPGSSSEPTAESLEVTAIHSIARNAHSPRIPLTVFSILGILVLIVGIVLSYTTFHFFESSTPSFQQPANTSASISVADDPKRTPPPTPISTFKPNSQTVTPTPASSVTITVTSTTTGSTPSPNPTNYFENQPASIISGSINLTTSGTLDWFHWGNQSRKSTASSQILSVSSIGSDTPATTPTPGGITYIWSDGTPSVSGNTATGSKISNLGNGWRLSLKADTQTRTVKLYVGIINARAVVTPNLGMMTTEIPIDTATHTGSLVIDCKYHGTAPNQILTLSLTMAQSYAPGSAVILEAITVA
jgi:hypothetical protein